MTLWAGGLARAARLFRDYPILSILKRAGCSHVQPLIPLVGCCGGATALQR